MVTFLSLCMFANLEELYLDNTKIDSSTIKEVVNQWNLRKLKLISLRNCSYLTAFALYYLHNGSCITNLETVYVD